MARGKVTDTDSMDPLVSADEMATALAVAPREPDAPARELVSRPHIVKVSFTAADRLAKPNPAGDDSWDPKMQLPGKVAKAGVGGAVDVWAHLFHTEACPLDEAGNPACTYHDATCQTVNGELVCDKHTHVGQKPPSWLLGRLGTTLRRFATEKLHGARDEQQVAEWLVRTGTNAPAITQLFEQAWLEATGMPVAPKTLAAATFDALDLLAGGVGWSEVGAALREAAFAGNSKISRTYEDMVAARRRDAARARAGTGTQGQVLMSAYELALAKQAEIDRQKGSAA